MYLRTEVNSYLLFMLWFWSTKLWLFLSFRSLRSCYFLDEFFFIDRSVKIFFLSVFDWFHVDLTMKFNFLISNSELLKKYIIKLLLIVYVMNFIVTNLTDLTIFKIEISISSISLSIWNFGDWQVNDDFFCCLWTSNTVFWYQYRS